WNQARSFPRKPASRISRQTDRCVEATWLRGKAMLASVMPSVPAADRAASRSARKASTSPSPFQAIEMRKGVRPDLLARAIQDLPDQRQSVVVGIALFVCSNLVEVMVGGYSCIAVARLARRKSGVQRLVRRKEQKTYRCPCAGDLALGEKVEQRGNGLTDAENIGAVIRNRALVTNAP